MNLLDVNIIDLIPQRPPIVMVDKLVNITKQSATSVFTILPNQLFSNEENLQAEGLIENIAQTSAAMNGYNALSENEQVKLGFIGAIKNLSIYQLPSVNSTIVTTIEIKNEVMNVNIIYGQIKQNDQLIAECEMKIFINN